MKEKRLETRLRRGSSLVLVLKLGLGSVDGSESSIKIPYSDQMNGNFETKITYAECATQTSFSRTNTPGDTCSWYVSQLLGEP